MPKKLRRSRTEGTRNEVDERRAKKQEGAQTLMEKVLEKKRQIEDKRQQYFKPDQGVNRIRIMPPWRKGETFYKEFATHYRVGPDEKGVTCLDFWDVKCPICERVEQLSESRNPRDLNLAGNIRRQSRYMLNVAKENIPDASIKVWTISESLFLEIIGYFGDADVGNFTDIKVGRDFKFTCKGTGLLTRYTNKSFGNPTRLRVEDWRDKLVNLDEFLKPMTRKQVRGIMRGEED